MQKNVGGFDRTARFVLGPLLVILAAGAFGGFVTLASGLIGAVAIWAALVIGLVLTVTAATQVCPLWKLFGINTFRGEQAETVEDAPEGRAEM